VDVQLSGGDGTSTYTLDFQLKGTSWSTTTSVKFTEKTTVSLSIPNDQVQLWWPNGHGDQPLYELTVTSGTQLMDSRLIGFRTVELIQHNYTAGIQGLSFYFQINGRPIFVKGSNWIPSDAFQERVTDEKLEKLLTSAKLAGMNMLRVWGGGIYERDSFYEMADRLGIMLWHDFMFACSLYVSLLSDTKNYFDIFSYPVDEPFLMNVHKEVIYQVQRLQSHPCIALWSGNNENEGILAGYIRPLPPAEQEAIKSDYRKLYIGTVLVALLEIDPTGSRPFVGSSPSNGIESVQENYTAKNPQDPLFGRYKIFINENHI
jgi:beta-mannosidase